MPQAAEPSSTRTSSDATNHFLETDAIQVLSFGTTRFLTQEAVHDILAMTPSSFMSSIL